MRSKTLWTSNVLSTVYSAWLIWAFGGAVIRAGGADYIEALGASFKFAFQMLGLSSPAVNFLYAAVILLFLHIITFVLGCLIGWISYAGKKSGGAKFAATLYLIGTICFPIFFIFGLPITIVGFIGGGKQKKLNSVEPVIG
jgi:hypothetical protein